MSGLIILLLIVLTIMMLPRLLMWWIQRRQRQFQEKINDMFGGSYKQHRAQATERASRHTYHPSESTTEDAEFETIAPSATAEEPETGSPETDSYTNAGDTDPIVDAEFEQIP